MASYEEYTKLLNDCVSNPDTAPVNIQTVLDTLKTDFETIKSLQEASNNQEKRIADLQTVNQQLFLKVTGNTEDVSQKTSEPTDEILKSILDQYNK